MANVKDEMLEKTPARSPLDDLAEHAQHVSHLCDLLEALADDLPRRPMPVWREAMRMCKHLVPVHYEEILNVVMPILKRRTVGERDCEDVLRRLQADFEDEAFRLSELDDLLEEVANPQATGNRENGNIGPEALGFALRGFFIALRRNSTWETDVVLPLASRHLNTNDLDEIAGSLNFVGVGRLH